MSKQNPIESRLPNWRAKVDDSAGPEGCWIWTGYRNSKGYGYLNMGSGRSPWRAHRFAFVMFVRPLREGEVVMHICDNPSCVNPAHLRAGTNAENTADMVAKGRARDGEKGPAKLTSDQVREIRRRAEAGETKATLAREFGLRPQSIGKIVLGRRWKRLDGDVSVGTPRDEQHQIDHSSESELAECGAHPASAACPECTACKRCGPCECELVAGWQQRTPA